MCPRLSQFIIISPFHFLEVTSNNNLCSKFPCRTKQLREERHAGKNVRHGVRKEMQKMLLTRKRGRGKGKNDEKRETQEKVCCEKNSDHAVFISDFPDTSTYMVGLMCPCVQHLN